MFYPYPVAKAVFYPNPVMDPVAKAVFHPYPVDKAVFYPYPAMDPVAKAVFYPYPVMSAFIIFRGPSWKAEGDGGKIPVLPLFTTLIVRTKPFIGCWILSVEHIAKYVHCAK